jgi:tetratricopeptide (TPR) repeat protein
MTESLLSRYETELSSPDYEDIAYDMRLRAAYERVNVGKFEIAINGLNAMLTMARAEDRPRLLLFLGIASEQLGNHDDAIQAFGKVLNEAHTSAALNAEAHYRLGAIYLRRGAAAWAKMHFVATEQSKGMVPHIPARDIYTFLAQAAECLGDESDRNRYLSLAKSAR